MGLSKKTYTCVSSDESSFSSSKSPQMVVKNHPVCLTGISFRVFFFSDADVEIYADLRPRLPGRHLPDLQAFSRDIPKLRTIYRRIPYGIPHRKYHVQTHQQKLEIDLTIISPCSLTKSACSITETFISGWWFQPI